MMPQIIPGGRQRASSDGDVLEDEDDTINASGVLDRLTEAHRIVSRSAILTTDDDRDSDDHRSITDTDRVTKTKKKGLRSKISFKSVKKAVSRAFPIKDSLFGSSSSLNKEEMPTNVRASSASGTSTWTPTSRSRTTENEYDRTDGSHSYRSNREGGDSAGTDSLSRPLVTDPERMVSKWDRTPGNVGLFNHGNTCFMNAVLQCLSHTDSFTEYFTTDLHKDDLKNSRNTSKKLGSKVSKGEVTEQLGSLLKCLWSDKYNSEISIDFKSVVGKYNSQYKGSSQHDAQEFLLWLLDRIHEDLTLPLPSQGKKKIKQSKSTVGVSRSQTDEELADAAETALTSSFVSKLFQGLHRSSLSCPHCGRLSNTFDPYLCVSLPLPQKCLRPVYVVVISLEEPMQSVTIGLSLNMYDTIRELREAVAADQGIPVEQIVLCELTKDGFYATYSNEQPLSDIPEACRVYAVEMYAEDPEAVQILLLHVERGRPSQRFCQPEVVKVSREVDMKQLQYEILRHLGDAVKREVFQQNLRSLFELVIVDGSSRKVYLPLDVEMPLYTQTVDRVLSLFGEEFGPQHLKLIVEWEPEIKEAVIQDDEEHMEEDASVKEVRSLSQQPVTVSLNECFQLYTQEEKLAGDDAWLCPHCKKPQKGASKTLGLWSLPDVLVLHLKRFKQTGMRRNKLNTLVEFPVEDLDMRDHVVHHPQSHPHPDHSNYHLIGVANHYGNMNGGHYTAFCKNAVDGQWQEFDDRHVKPLGQRQVVSGAAYILWYQRRSLVKAVNQRVFTGSHWVFTALQRHPGDKSSSSSPQRRKASEAGSPVKRRGIQDDLEHVAAATPFERGRVFSKEWNGQSSPTRRPANRPLTPQPPRRQTSLELGTYDQSPTVIKGRPSFRASRPSLSRQVSEGTAARGKKQLFSQDGGEGEGRGNNGRGEGKHSTGAQLGRDIQSQALQVHLPPKSSSVDRDILAGEVPRGSNSEVLQPEQVHLPSSSQSAVQHKAGGPPPVGKESAAAAASSAKSSKSSKSSAGFHHVSKPVDVAVVEVTAYRPEQGRPQLSTSPPDSFSSQKGRPWQYESQSSRSSHDTQSSNDSQRSQTSPRGEQDSAVVARHSNGSSNGGSEFYDWRQPESRANRQNEQRTERHPEKRNSGLGSPSRPATAVTSRVNANKPPLPPKILTRGADARSESSSSSSPMHRQQDEYHVTLAAPSLTSPPSPAPKDSGRDIRRLSQQEPRGLPQRGEPQLITTTQDPRPLAKEPRLISQEPPRLSLPPEPRLSLLGESRAEPRLLPADPRVLERHSQGERFIALNREQHWDEGETLLLDGEIAGERHVLKDGEFEKRRSKIASQIPGESMGRRRRSPNMGELQKFATIGPCHQREPQGHGRDSVATPAVPRSSTDHSIHFNHYGHSPSLSSSSRPSPRYSAGYSPGYPPSQRSASPSSVGRDSVIPQWDSPSPSPHSQANVPMYARESVESGLHSANKVHGPIYRGAVFQVARAKKSSTDIAAPSLRESSV